MPEHVYHYTSYQALFGIIQKNGLIFHGSRYDCMNDSNDCMFARQIVLPSILASLGHTDFIPKEKENIESFPYVVSFSEKGDNESMWQHYGSQVCLILSSDKIKKGCDVDGKHIATWGKCYYAEEENVPTVVMEIFNNMKQSDNILDNIMEACSFIKRKAFEREGEWRLVSNDYYLFSFSSDRGCEDKEIPNENTDFKIGKSGKPFPFKHFHINSSALKGIIINEDNLTEFLKIKQYVKLLLTKKGFSNIEIKQTNKYPL